MYTLFRQSIRSTSGVIRYPQLPYLRRSFERMVREVKQYYRRHPKRVGSENPLGNLLQHIPQRWDLDDQRYVRFVEDASPGVARAFGFTSSIHRGWVHESGLTLGPKTNEVVLTSYTPFAVEQAAKQWWEWESYRYLYHTRTDLGLPIPNNTSPGRGHGVAVLNIPQLALQYRYWLKHQQERFGEEKESVYRFIGGFVLPNAITSYLDIAYFNRLARRVAGISSKRYPTPHPFYLTDFSRQVDQLCEQVHNTVQQRRVGIEELVHITPMLLRDNLRDVIQLPTDPVTRQNEWAYLLARFPYIKYLLEATMHHRQGDQRQWNAVYLTLVEARHDQAFSGVGSTDIVKHYRKQLNELLATIEAAR